ncbi:unnamed protein product [Discula destructiva]
MLPSAIPRPPPLPAALGPAVASARLSLVLLRTPKILMRMPISQKRSSRSKGSSTGIPPKRSACESTSQPAPPHDQIHPLLTNIAHSPRFRAKPPYKFAAIYERATTQRFFVLSRTLCGTPADPEAMFEVSGSTGNIYNVCIARQPTCDCPHARAGNQCKHTLFVLKKVLRAREDLVYQLALLSSELREIFAAAPPAPEKKTGAGAEDKNRKALEGDCPICFEEMEAGPGKEALVWCKAACGQNIHKQCFDMWAATKRQSGKVTCPYCRSNWEVQTDTVGVASIRRGGARNKDGYVNIADQLGISTQRDYSTYSQWWSGRSSYRGRRFGGF